jgi:hypothetical protein
MMYFSPRSIVGLVKDRLTSLAFGKRLALTAFLFLIPLLITSDLQAQQVAAGADGGGSSDKQTIQLLLKRIDQLEARVSQLESGKESPAAAQAPSPSTPTPLATPVAEAEAPPEHPEGERMDVSKTLMNIRGFGDVNFHGDTAHGDTTSFTLGQLDLFITSDISEKFKFLGEVVFEAGRDNSFGVDLERYLLQYSRNDHFNLSIGRYHTAIGYYNTAYHHSTWLQTATGRPFLFLFEDNGGVLPIHNVGVSATGSIPSGRLGLHYVAEVGNGRASLSPNVEAVQNVVDENNGKSVNLAFFVKPEAIRGLQAGFSYYHDGLKPAGLPDINETILAAHAVVVRPNFEWLNEALLIRHALKGTSSVFNTPGFYTQFSKRFGSYRPYFRYQYVNEANAEPVFPQVGRRQGPSVGLRFDPSESVAIKLQYDYTTQRNLPATNGLNLQFGFTF